VGKKLPVGQTNTYPEDSHSGMYPDNPQDESGKLPHAE